ncbi:hypothetical protein [Legionella steigerwaltii]|uniref:hypothetical protein n=1 Tax=Legionella steigerwaltii TaxID=460 RepID=UPI000730AF18|nr:hypothetical protein [Legionella steigerwaltii]
MPNHVYLSAGIKINTPGYKIADLGVVCKPIPNGYCLFSVSDKTPKAITLLKTNAYSISGSISGLTANGLVLHNGSDNLPVSANANAFQFPSLVPYGGSYNVTVVSQPANLTCTVTNGSGSNITADVTNVSVSCTVNTYTVGGTISGLTTNGLVLQNNGGDNLPVSANDKIFQFPTALTNNSSYLVTILSQPTGLTCTITNGAGVINGSSINNVTVNCHPRFAYITDLSANLWQCPMNATGGFSGTCTSLTNTPSLFPTTGATLDTFSGTTYAYIGTENNPLWQCPIDPTTGGFSGTCTNLTNSPSFFDAFAPSFHTFSGVTYAYVGDLTNTLWQCPIDATTGGFSSSCTALTNTPAFNAIRFLTFQTFSGITYAYLSDTTSKIWQCPMNATGGFSGTCTALTNPTSPFNSTVNVAFYTFSGTTYAYIADNTSTLWQCPMNASGGFSAPCTALTNSPAFLDIIFNSFYTFSGTTYAYIGDATQTLWQCPMNATTGGFAGPCNPLTNTPAFSATVSATFSA